MQDNHHPTRRVTYGHIKILKLKLLIKYRIINHLEESHSISLRIRQDPNQFYFHQFCEIKQLFCNFVIKEDHSGSELCDNGQ